MVCSWLLILLYKYIFDSTSAAVRVFLDSNAGPGVSVFVLERLLRRLNTGILSVIGIAMIHDSLEYGHTT